MKLYNVDLRVPPLSPKAENQKVWIFSSVSSDSLGQGAAHFSVKHHIANVGVLWAT